MDLQQKRMRDVLEDTIQYFDANPKRRCSKGGNCEYNPAVLGIEAVSDGCAIGRYMTPEQKTEAGGPTGQNLVVDQLPPDLIPDVLKGLPMDFLTELQSLHDRNDTWTAEGLSTIGLSVVERMRKDWGLN